MSLLSDGSGHHHEVTAQHLPVFPWNVAVQKDTGQLSALEEPASFHKCFWWVWPPNTPFAKSKQPWKVAGVVCAYDGGIELRTTDDVGVISF